MAPVETGAEFQCCLCGRYFLDGDFHEAGFVQLPPHVSGIEVIKRWLGHAPVCEDCGLERGIPAEEE